ncbi:MAG: hypothetical protein M1831_004117 [Alyxoria varia]|nr:MAG: hypothetical protein M1831_004117 [Alyxoria varia]
MLEPIANDIKQESIAHEKDLTNHENHIKGVAALIRNRGSEMFENPRSMKIFRSLRTVLLSTCVRMAQPLVDFEQDPFWSYSMGLESSTSSNLSLRTLSLPRLRAEAKDLVKQTKSDNNVEKAFSLINEAQNLDEKLEEWYQNKDDVFQFSTKSVICGKRSETTDHVYGSTLRIYHDLGVSHTLNRYSVLRIYTNNIVINCSKWLSTSPEDTVYFKALYTIRKMVDDICAGVPFHLNYAEDGQTCDPRGKDDDDIAKDAMGAFHLMWPLAVALKVDIIPDAQRQWIKERMQFFSDTYDYSHAGRMSHSKDC